MRSDLLRKLADYIATVPPERLDMNLWGARLGFFRRFHGCALGHAANAKLFEGLRIVEGRPSYLGASGYRAAALLFGIPVDDAVKLFSGQRWGGASDTPLGVALAIGLYVEMGGFRA